MILAKQAKLLEKLITDNSPTILSAIGIVGTCATAYFTGKASFKAAEMISDEIQDRKERIGFDERNLLKERLEIPRSDLVKLVWKEYIPAVGSGVITVVAIFGANRISARRAAAMAVAYSLSEKKFEEFREKAYSKLTPAKQQAVRDEIAQDHIDKNPLSQQKQVIVLGAGDVMCYDKQSDRYFKSNVEKLRKTQNDINQEVLGDNLPVTVADFYRYIGLKPTPQSNEIGWTNEMLLELDFSTCMTDDSQPCIVIDFDSTAIRGSSKSGSDLGRDLSG